MVYTPCRVRAELVAVIIDERGLREHEAGECQRAGPLLRGVTYPLRACLPTGAGSTQEAARR